MDDHGLVLKPAVTWGSLMLEYRHRVLKLGIIHESSGHHQIWGLHHHSRHRVDVNCQDMRSLLQGTASG